MLQFFASKYRVIYKHSIFFVNLYIFLEPREQYVSLHHLFIYVFACSLYSSPHHISLLLRIIRIVYIVCTHKTKHTNCSNPPSNNNNKTNNSKPKLQTNRPSSSVACHPPPTPNIHLTLCVDYHHHHRHSSGGVPYNILKGKRTHTFPLVQ